MNVKEALQVLELAAEKGNDDVKNIFSSEYHNLRKTLMSNAPHFAWNKIKDAKNTAVDYTIDKAELFNKSFHESPWYYLGGASIVAIGVGFLLGRSMK